MQQRRVFRFGVASRADDGVVCFCLAWYKGQFKPSPTDIRQPCRDHELWHCLGIAAGACTSHAARRHRVAVTHRRRKLPSSIDMYGIYASPPACHYRCWRQPDGRCNPTTASLRPSAVRYMSGCWAGRTLSSRSISCLKAAPVVTYHTHSGPLLSCFDPQLALLRPVRCIVDGGVCREAALGRVLLSIRLGGFSPL